VRLIKMFGLAMLAAVAAMAFAGAGTASAAKGTVVCHLDAKETVAPCPSGSLPYKGPLLALKGATETLGLSLFEGGIHISCETEVHGEITSSGSATTHAHGLINSVLFTNCSSPSCAHKVEAVAHNLPWLVSARGSATLGDGQLHITEDGKGFPGGLFTCHTLVFGFPTLVTCGYSTESALVDVDGHLKAGKTKLLANKMPLNRVHGSGSFCSEKATWTYLPFVHPEDLSLHLIS
jgi:hypothetical protein